MHVYKVYKGSRFPLKGSKLSELRASGTLRPLESLAVPWNQKAKPILAHSTIYYNVLSYTKRYYNIL